MNKAKFIEKTIIYDYYKNEKEIILTYDYRGHKYEVIDRGWKAPSYMRGQHLYEQQKIDEVIEMKEKEKNPTHVGEDAQVGFNKLFEYWETGVFEG